MKQLVFCLLLLLSLPLHGLITHVTVFEKQNGTTLQRVIICGDSHRLGRWADNIEQFLQFIRAIEQEKNNCQILVENLISPTDNFNSPTDKQILALKEQHVSFEFASSFLAPRPPAMPTLLNFFGCSAQFYQALARTCALSDAQVKSCSNLRVTNLDNRHEHVYYGESLAGWKFGPYNLPGFQPLQQAEAERRNLYDLLKPRSKLATAITQSSGALQSIYGEIWQRQEAMLQQIEAELGQTMGISRATLASTSLARLNEQSGGQLYRYLPKSPLAYLLREMVEANALMQLCKKDASATIIIFAGTNHTGHNSGIWQHQTPGLTRFLAQLGYRTTYENIINDPARAALEIPATVRQQLDSARSLRRAIAQTRARRCALQALDDC